MSPSQLEYFLIHYRPACVCVFFHIHVRKSPPGSPAQDPARRTCKKLLKRVYFPSPSETTKITINSLFKKNLNVDPKSSKRQSQADFFIGDKQKRRTHSHIIHRERLKRWPSNNLFIRRQLVQRVTDSSPDTSSMGLRYY